MRLPFLVRGCGAPFAGRQRPMREHALRGFLLLRVDPCRCTTFAGLLTSCVKAADGSIVLRTFPALNCVEIDGRVATGVLGVVGFCIGIPLALVVLLFKYHRRQFRSALAYFLVRSIFSGHKDTLLGMAYRVWTMLRTLAFVVISLSPLPSTVQGIGILMLVVASMLLEGLAEPRNTHIMSLLGCLEEVVLCLVVSIGLLEIGAHPLDRCPSLILWHALP